MVAACELVIPCLNLNANLDFFIQRLGFRVAQISPADDPVMAVVKRDGCAIRLEQGEYDLPPNSGISIRIRCDQSELATSGSTAVAPNGGNSKNAKPKLILFDTGLQVLRVLADTPLELPEPVQSLIVTRAAPQEDAVAGRAGMLYTDLIPGRMGGAFIASDIAIPEGGPVNDYVHFHKIRFQIIYVKAGWVKVVYEDQGDPFIMHAGDCVIQPPQIRHRVLESSRGLQVIEIGAPAIHDTFGDLELELPNHNTGVEKDSNRLWEGQRFHFHSNANAIIDSDGVCDLGMEKASNGVFSLTVLNFDIDKELDVSHDGELLFFYLLKGSLAFQEKNDGANSTVLKEGDSCTFPGGRVYGVRVEKGSQLLKCFVIKAQS
ncbi:UNVERIFIED_CONTAM: hypothetical protein HDU68_008091 [Siphonaria sp. JEL0065]|nr:hypothetical protein HDU68_008091 [Siphonaria sp. JEL0065]